MSTSLVEQLRRLAAPQTSLLVDSTKRASILFDPKEAANTDRATIFDYGHNGLMELVSLSSSFLQFEQTLFDRSTMTFERSVADKEVNRHLDKTIKRFFHHLSPYFMLQPAHMCLEWLIRRYHIELFNKTELLQLIMPYHETKIFVRCIQLLNLSEPIDPWCWLQPIQRPGVPLSKSSILNRAASDQAFLKFVCKSTADAVKELDTKAHTLQAQLAFYCTTVIGALEYAKAVQEWHVTCILPSLLKGLVSKVLDFAAAANMIAAQLVVRTTLSSKFLHALIAKICESGQPALQNDCVLLLVLIFDSQTKNLKTIPDDALKNLVEKKWLSGSLGQMAAQGIVLSPFLVPLMAKCLHRVQTKGDDWLACKVFAEQLLLEVHLTENEAKNLIRCVLDSYYRKSAPAQNSENEVIEIDSDDDEMDGDTQAWYSDFLQKLERQYPGEFDFTIKETMQGKADVSESRKQALQTALAFRLKSHYSEDNIPIYENLYHHSASNRTEAVKYLVKNFNKLALSSNDTLLRDSLIDRLSDDDPKVLSEVLKLNTSALVEALGADSTVDRLLNILHKNKRGSDKWLKVTAKVLDHLAKRLVWPKTDAGKILISVMPFLLPTSIAEVALVKQILSGDIIDIVPLLKTIATKVRGANQHEAIAETTLNLLLSAKDLPTADELLKLFDPTHYVYFLLLWTVSYQNRADAPTGIKIFDIIAKTAEHSEFVVLRPNEKWYQAVRSNQVPLNMMLEFLLVIAKRTERSDFNRFYDNSSDSSSLILKIFEFLATNAFINHKNRTVKAGYTEALKSFLDSICPSAADKFEFLANFFVSERMAGIESTPELQIRAIRLFSILIESRTERDCKLDRLSFVKVLIALNGKNDVVRECALNTLEALCENEALEPKFDSLARQILQRREEIVLDYLQFPLVLFMLVSSSKKSKAASVLDDLIAIVIDPEVENVMKASTLRIMKHINHLAVFKRTIKAGIDVLEHIETMGEHCVLDQARSDILKYVVSQLQESTVKILADDESAWKLLSKLLKLHRVTMHHENQIRSVAVLVMDVFDEELYKKLPAKHKNEFVERVVAAITFANDNSLISSGNRLVKRISLDGKHVAPVLASMKHSCTTSAARKGVKAIAPDSDVLNSAEWKMGITLLELLQNKKKMENFISIIPSLAELLQKCLEFEEQSNLEYAKQLILSCLLQCCQKIASEGNRKNAIPDTTFRIDLIVQCIRATQNPQTHHHALLLLSQCAAMFPQQVLHNIMDIFTFMGSSVVRHDDAFSIQIITKIVESIVPTLVDGGGSASGEEKRVVPVLRVFSDIILDVPEHRRIPLYTKLMSTLGSGKYLWMFLCVLLESHVVHDEKEKFSATQRRFANIFDETPKRIEFALQLLKDFDAGVALDTCIALFEYLRMLPMEKDDNEKMVTDEAETILFDVERHSSKQLRHFKYVLVQYISNFTSSLEFINRIAALDDESTKSMKPRYQEFIIKILCCVPQVTAAIEQNSDSTQVKYWKVMLHHCYDVLENAISLLSPDMLLVVVHGLMQHKLPTVRKKVIEILIAKLQYKTDYFAKCNEEYLVNLLEPLNGILDTILDMEATHTPEVVLIQQTSLIAIKLLSRVMALKHAELFKELLNKLTKILKKRESIAKILLATVVLAITEICSNLKAHSISQLSNFMPHVINALHDHSQALISQSPDTVTIAILAGIQKLFEAVPLFLGPYMVEILIALITVWSHTMKHEDEARATVVLTKLNAICVKIASACPLRIVIPVCDKTYRKLYDAKQYLGIKYLMKLLKDCMEKLTGDEIQEQQSDLYAFFLTALEFRTQLSDSKDQHLVSDIEESILQSFVALILKLSESSFRPLYHKVYDWAIRENQHQKDRAITYFLLSSKIAEALKSLFVLFAGDFVQDAADLLNKCNTFKSEQLYFADSDAKNVFLVENILSTLNNVFVHDSKDFINEHRFDILMQPIVDQLQNRLVLESEQLKTLLVSCVAELAFLVRSDTLWKQLNYQVLLKTRNNNPEIRIASIQCCVAVARKLGEQFVPLLPETIPFVAELLEDENERVEKACRKEIAELERVTGVSLNQFF